MSSNYGRHPRRQNALYRRGSKGRPPRRSTTTVGRVRRSTTTVRGARLGEAVLMIRFGIRSKL